MPVPVRLNTGILGLAFIKLYFELSIYTILFLSYFQQHNITLVFSGRFLNLSAAWSVFNFRPAIRNSRPQKKLLKPTATPGWRNWRRAPLKSGKTTRFPLRMQFTIFMRAGLLAVWR